MSARNYSIRAQWWDNEKQTGVAVDGVPGLSAGDALLDATPDDQDFTHAVIIICPSAELGMMEAKAVITPIEDVTSAPDILNRLADLHHQATVERSHYYTGRCLMEAMAEIMKLRQLLKGSR